MNLLNQIGQSLSNALIGGFPLTAPLTTTIENAGSNPKTQGSPWLFNVLTILIGIVIVILGIVFIFVNPGKVAKTAAKLAA